MAYRSLGVNTSVFSTFYICRINNLIITCQVKMQLFILVAKITCQIKMQENNFPAKITYQVKNQKNNFFDKIT